MWSSMRSSFRLKYGEFTEKWSLSKSRFRCKFVNINNSNTVLCLEFPVFLKLFSMN